jgi:transposase
MAMELSNTKWKLAFTTGTQNPREVNIPIRDTEAIKRTIARTKEKFGLSADAPVRNCYETGRDGFWLHRYLASMGVENVVVDAASIEKPRKARTPKTNRLDAQKLLNCLMRHWRGENRVWGIARAPTEAEEDARRVHRERDRLRREKTAHLARIKELFMLIGIAVRWVPEWKDCLHLLKTWDGKPIPEGLRREIDREYERLELPGLQIEALKDQMGEQLDKSRTAAEQKAQKLYRSRRLRPITALTLGMELSGWRNSKKPSRSRVAGAPGRCAL